MKKVLITLALVAITAVNATAQKIGYFSYNQVLTSMTAYTAAQANITELKKQYADELKNAEEEFNEKYEMFLEQQSTLAESIRQKRQADLQVLLDRNVMFKKEAERLVNQAEKEAMAPLKEKITKAINDLGATNEYFIIVNTDSEACPYINPAIAVDVTDMLLEKTK